MKLLLISILGFVVSGVCASSYEPYTYTSLRGSAFTDSLSTSTARNLQNDPFTRIHCSWNSRYTRQNILRQCARRDDGHYWPYDCEDGRSMCCTESYINEPNLRNFGRCTRVPGGPLWPDRPDPDHPGDNRRPDRKPGSIHCIAPNEWRFDREEPEDVCDSLTPNFVHYSCDGLYENICCTDSLMAEVHFDKFGKCYKHDTIFPDKRRKLSHVDCFGPPAGRPCPEGRVPYTCEGGEEICCVWSNLPVKRLFKNRLMEDITLDELGLCTRDDGLEGASAEELSGDP